MYGNGGGRRGERGTTTTEHATMDEIKVKNGNGIRGSKFKKTKDKTYLVGTINVGCKKRRRRSLSVSHGIVLYFRGRGEGEKRKRECVGRNGGRKKKREDARKEKDKKGTKQAPGMTGREGWQRNESS